MIGARMMLLTWYRGLLFGSAEYTGRPDLLMGENIDHHPFTSFDELKPAEYNPRTISENAFHGLKKSMTDFENSSYVGSLVYDAFGGSGTCVIACEQTNRTCITSEFDLFYCSTIIKRWEDLTGLKAVKNA